MSTQLGKNCMKTVIEIRTKTTSVTRIFKFFAYAIINENCYGHLIIFFGSKTCKDGCIKDCACKSMVPSIRYKIPRPKNKFKCFPWSNDLLISRYPKCPLKSNKNGIWHVLSHFKLWSGKATPICVGIQRVKTLFTCENSQLTSAQLNDSNDSQHGNTDELCVCEGILQEYSRSHTDAVHNCHNG